MPADSIKIAWSGPHFGEEPPLVGKNGAGAVFFSGCNMRCVFCQNWQISQGNIGKYYSPGEFKKMMLDLQNKGALNIDLVSPTIWAERIRQPIAEAKKEGLKIPVVWNSNACESTKILKSLEGLVDIYLPDFKYGDNEAAFKYSGAKEYVERAKEALKEMVRQVGPENVIVRHMILPDNVENSKRALERIKEISPDISLSLISQYEPVYKADKFPEINRNISKKEFEEVFNYMSELGFSKGWVQDMESHGKFLPDFAKENPF
ncbi:MAG: radical SAM protein [Candidatus Paceibacterota bacterium]|jgi:putative pyruvate formate lyase activating enzyme